MIHKRSTPWNGQYFLLEGLNWFYIPLFRCGSRQIDVWLAWRIPNLSMDHLLVHVNTNRDIKKRLSKDKAAVVYKDAIVYTTEYPSKIYLTVKVSKGAKIRNRYNKYHTRPRIPMGKWQTHSRHHKREPRGQPFPSRWPQSTYKQTRTKT